MALAAMLEQAGFHPTDIQTGAEVNIEKTGEGFGITDIVLSTVATVPDIDAEGIPKARP